MPTLRDATLLLERGVNAALGDEITYTFASGESLTFFTWVEFSNTTVGGGASAAAIDAYLVEVPIDQVPDPVADDRIEITILPGKVFAMKSRERGENGQIWRLPLKKALP